MKAFLTQVVFSLALWALAPVALAATATVQLQQIIDDHWQYSLQEIQSPLAGWG